MIFYGTSASRLGDYQINNTACTHCGETAPQHTSIFGRYAYLYWIPLFPIGKVVVNECTHCKRTLEEKELSPGLRQRTDRLKSELGTPKKHFAGLGIIGAIILAFVFFDYQEGNDPRNAAYLADLDLMEMEPAEDSTSLAYLMDQMNTFMVVEELEPENFSYLTRTEGDRALVLIKIPTIYKLDEVAYPELAEIITSATTSFDEYVDKRIHYGIVNGSESIVMSRGPEDVEFNVGSDRSPIWAFYGKAEE